MNFEQTLRDSKKLHEELISHMAALTPEKRLVKRRRALKAFNRVYANLKHNHEDQAAEMLIGIIHQVRITLN